MSNLAIRQFTGNMQLEGVIVLEGPDNPELAFVDRFRQIEIEKHMGYAEPLPQGKTWADVLLWLVESQDMLTVNREGPFETDLTAEELLQVSLAALQDGVAVNELPRRRGERAHASA